MFFDLIAEDLKIVFEKNPCERDRVKVWMWSKHTQSVYFYRDGQWVTHKLKEYESIPENEYAFVLPFSMLQSLADGLAEFGIYQNKVKPLENELSATKYHLEDLRKLLKLT